MHVKNNLPYDFELEDPLILESELRGRADLIAPFIRYMLGLDMDGEEYKKLKTRWLQGSWLKAGYFKALADLEDYWNEHKEAIRLYRLSGYDGVSFLIKKLIENRQGLFYLDKDLDMEMKEEEIEEFKDRKKKKKRGIPLYAPAKGKDEGGA